MLKPQVDNLQNQNMTKTSSKYTSITQEPPTDKNQTTSKPTNATYIFFAPSTFTNTAQHNYRFHHQHQQLYEVSPQGEYIYIY